MKFVDIKGLKFNRLTAIKIITRSPKIKWLFKCDCGKDAVAVGFDVKSGKQKSCGCLNREVAKCRATTHGDTVNRKTTKEFRAYNNMIARCYRESSDYYKNYGGRGIKVCDRWRESFENFLSDMGRAPSPGHSLDRISNDGDYTPANCRWATREEQAQNRRDSRRLTLNGDTLTLTEWARKLGIHKSTLITRLNANWPIERVLSK